MCIHVSVWGLVHMYTDPEESQERGLDSQRWNYRQLWATSVGYVKWTEALNKSSVHSLSHLSGLGILFLIVTKVLGHKFTRCCLNLITS